MLLCFQNDGRRVVSIHSNYFDRTSSLSKYQQNFIWRLGVVG